MLGSGSRTYGKFQGWYKVVENIPSQYKNLDLLDHKYSAFFSCSVNSSGMRLWILMNNSCKDRIDEKEFFFQQTSKLMGFNSAFFKIGLIGSGIFVCI